MAAVTMGTDNVTGATKPGAPGFHMDWLFWGGGGDGCCVGCVCGLGGGQVAGCVCLRKGGWEGGVALDFVMRCDAMQYVQIFASFYDCH